MEPISNQNEVTVKSLLEKTSEILTESEGTVIEVLTSVVEATPPEGVLFSCFELFDTQDYGMNYNTFYILERNGKKELRVNYAPLEVQGTSYTDGKSFIPALFEYTQSLDSVEFSEADGMEFTKKHEEDLLAWFTKCWKAAGGEHSKLPTYFAFDKELTFKDALTGEVAGKSMEIAKKLGYEDLIPDQGDFGPA